MYTFQLQTVLDHRQFSEDNLKKELADIRQQLLSAQEQLDVLKTKEMNTAAALNSEQAQGISSDQVVAYHAFLMSLSERIAGQKTVIGDLKAQESEKQIELSEALKKRQIIEKLKAQGLDRYNRLIQKKEMEFIDEIAVNQFFRKTSYNSRDEQ
jgi:flagellar FliJ protein